MSARQPAESDEPDQSVTILRGDPTPEELAAITAVLMSMAEESADDAVLESGTAPSAWQQSTRSLRTPLHPGPGAWRGFAG